MLQNSDKSIFEYKIPPYFQAGGVLVLMLLLMIGAKMLGATGLIDTDAGTPWLISVSMTFFYVIFSSVLSISSENQNQYFLYAIISFVGLCIVGGLMAYLFSGVSMDEVGAYRWLYMVFTIGYILFLIIMRSMRKIVRYAQTKDKRLRGED